MTTQLVLATRNRHKIEELDRILAASGLDVELLGSEAFADLPDTVEDGDTFAANALLKARAVRDATGLAAVADDSGLCVDALNGMPGIFSARWAGRHGDDRANLELLLGQIADVPDERRGGRFRCAAALALPDGTERVVEGELAGTILWSPRGDQGFGYDPIFRPEGGDSALAELPPAQKDAISHRGRALAALVPVLQEVLPT